MNILKIVEGFVYGELSPLMAGQVESKAYKQSAKELSNFIPDPRGPAIRRPGAQFITSVTGEACKLAKVQTAPNQAFVIMLTALKATVIPEAVPSHSTNLVANGYFRTGNLSWVVETQDGEVDIEYRRTLLRPGNAIGGYAQVSQAIQIPDSTVNYSLDIRGLFRGPHSTESVDVKVGTTPGASDLAVVALYENATYHALSIPAPAVDTIFITIVANSWSGVSNTDTESYLESLFLAAVPSSIANSVLTSPYTDAQLKDINIVRVPNEDKIFLLHKDVEPHELGTTDLLTWALQPVTITSPPASWTAGSYPTTVAFYQSRSVWGGTLGDQETFVMSKTADYYDLTIGTNADDALSFTIDREGSIRWIIGSKALLLGTVNGEYKITSEAGVIMPSDIQIDFQSAHGASNVQPILVGTETVFPTVDGRALRAMFYFWEDDGWVAEDLSFATNHITYSGIKELVVSINPEPILWMALNDGALVGCSYQFQNTGSSKDKRVTGWHRHTFTYPVVSMVVIENFGHSVLLVALKVPVEGSNEIHLCYLDFNTDSEVFLDDSITIYNNVASASVSGLDHLEGLTVDILADGATHVVKTVVGGAVTLDEPAQVVVVGLPYVSRLVTQPAVLATKEGTIKHQLGRWSEAFVYILDSALPLIDGIRAEEFEATTRMGYKQDRITGFTNSTQFGWERDSVLTIEQDLPLPLVVSHIAGELDK